ncbi:MAG TPA: dienelactone hydrolase family protein [Burkholderiaceae bacterium]|nr:dienelactone hydrolase family protein [Burkholderiaceae bacterium]
MRHVLCSALCALAAAGAAAQSPWGTPSFPQDADKWWWDQAWWESGRMHAPANHPVTEHKASYRSGDVDVPLTIFRPQASGSAKSGADRGFKVVVFLHGRRGLDEFTRLVPLRLAARGFVVVAPDLFSGRFIEPFPVAHDYALEEDTARAIDFALALPDAKGQPKTCVVSHTRGGYYALKALVTKERQRRIACYVSYYPHWQDPNAGEVAQVYQFAPEVEALTVPVLVFVGEHEQYQRVRSILAAINALRAKGRDARVLVYPGVGRGFDFRARNVRTFADDLAAQDSLMRAAAFLTRHLSLQ